MRLDLGLPVDCSDGPCGTVADVVIDPLRRRVTHVVVEPHHRHDRARLVPIQEVVLPAGGTGLRLRCRSEELERWPYVEETAYLRLDEWPELDGDWDVGVATVLAHPYYDSPGIGGGMYVPLPPTNRVPVAYDRIPASEVEIRRDSAVEDADGKEIGRVDGFLVDAEWHVTHIVLDKGHLWRHREVTIPVRNLKRIVNDRVVLDLTADEVGALPAVPVRRHHVRDGP